MTIAELAMPLQRSANKPSLLEELQPCYQQELQVYIRHKKVASLSA